MTDVRRFASSVLLAAGLVMVFAGLNRALGLSVPGFIASVAAVAILLYAGATWFGPRPGVIAPAGSPAKVIVFDRMLAVVAGTTPGTYLPGVFPEAVRREVEEHCRAALAGEHRHFSCELRGVRVAFDVAPVPNPAGIVLYGTLAASSGVAAPVLSPAPAHA